MKHQNNVKFRRVGYFDLPPKQFIALLWDLNRMGLWLGSRPITILCILLVFFGLTAVYGLTFSEGASSHFAVLVSPPIVIAILAGSAASPFTQVFARNQGRSAQFGFLLAAAVAVVMAMISLLYSLLMNFTNEILFSATEAFFLTSFAAIACVFMINFCHGAELDKRADDIFFKYDQLIFAEFQPIQKRLPATKRGIVLSLSVEKKFLTVMTESGSHIIRLPIRQALVEMDEDEGLMLDRRNWVRITQIEALKKEHGKVFVKLKDGRSVKVSRSRQRDVTLRLMGGVISRDITSNICSA